MTFIILTIKDTSGFCLWDSKESNYSVRNSPVKDDIVKAYVSACLDEGLVPGIHYAVPDMLNEQGRKGSNVKEPIGKLYIDHMKKQLSEILSIYPQVGIISLDDAQRLSKTQVDDLKQLVTRLNPKCVLWSCHDGRSVQDTIIKSWVWNASAPLKMAGPIVAHYQQTQANGKAFILNVGPDRTGHIPQNQLAVLLEVNKRIAALSSTQTYPAPGPGNAPNANGNTVERLKNLKSLYGQGLINKEDYDRKMKELLDTL